MAKSDKLARKARARARAEEAAHTREGGPAGVSAADGGPRIIGGKTAYERRLTGLEQLRNRGKITATELAAGERYGSLFREAQLEGEAQIRSALGGMDEPRGAGGAPLVSLLRPEYLAQVRQKLRDAQFDALRSQAGLIAVCDVICGKQWTPQQITPNRADQLQIETSLRIALDLLADHWAAAAKSGNRAA